MSKKSRACCLVNQPVILDVGVKNNTQNTINFAKRGMILSYFSFEVKTDDGAQVPLTQYGKFLLDARDAGRTGTGMVESGKEATEEVVISQIYDFSLSGEYNITGTFKGKSNTTSQYKSSRTLKVRIRQ